MIEESKWLHTFISCKCYKNKVTHLWEGPSELNDAAGGNTNIGENGCELPPVAAAQRVCLMEMLGKASKQVIEEWKMKCDFQPVWVRVWRKSTHFVTRLICQEMQERNTIKERKSYFSGISFSGAAMGAAGWAARDGAGADQETAAVDVLQSQKKRRKPKI